MLDLSAFNAMSADDRNALAQTALARVSSAEDATARTAAARDLSEIITALAAPTEVALFVSGGVLQDVVAERHQAVRYRTADCDVDDTCATDQACDAFVRIPEHGHEPSAAILSFACEPNHDAEKIGMLRALRAARSVVAHGYTARPGELDLPGEYAEFQADLLPVLAGGETAAAVAGAV